MALSPALAENLNNKALATGHTILSAMSQWYHEGFFHTMSDDAWNQQLNAAALSAIMARYDLPSNGNTAVYRQIAVDTVNRAIKRNIYTNQSGSFIRFSDGAEGIEDESGPTGDDTINIETIASIGSIMYSLDNSISDDDRKAWLHTLTGCLDYLATLNYPYWYINGNYAIHLALCYWYVQDQCFKLNLLDTGKKYLALYQDSYSMVVSPSTTVPPPTNTQWVGYGQRIDVQGTWIDFSDTTGYITETDGYKGVNPNPAYDQVYGLLQLDLLSEWYTVSRDFRVMKILNMSHNKMEPFITTSNWTINCNGGSRNPTGGIRGYTGGWMQGIALLGLRSSNRTIFSDVNMLSSYDSCASSLTSTLANSQVAQFTLRQWRIAIGGTIRACNQANKIIT